MLLTDEGLPSFYREKDDGNNKGNCQKLEDRLWIVKHRLQFIGRLQSPQQFGHTP